MANISGQSDANGQTKNRRGRQPKSMALRSLSIVEAKSNLAGLPRRDQDEPSSPVNTGFKIKYSNFVNKPCWPEIRIRRVGGVHRGPEKCFCVPFRSILFDDLIDMTASSAEDLLRLSPAHTTAAANSASPGARRKTSRLICSPEDERRSPITQVFDLPVLFFAAIHQFEQAIGAPHI
jgi:hypothetical protein